MRPFRGGGGGFLFQPRSPLEDGVFYFGKMTKGKKTIPAGLSCAALLMLLWGSAWPASFWDEVGRGVELSRPPKRIVSVAPSVTEILFAIGLAERVVGVSTYCNYPPEARHRKKVGTYAAPSLEKIVALKPDLVLGTADGNLKSFAGRLADLGIRVYIADPRTAEAVMVSIRRIGEVTSSAEAARRVAAKMEERIRLVQRKADGLPRLRVLHAMGFGPLISSGKTSLMNDMIRLGGGSNVLQDVQAKHPRLNMEDVILRDPEVIILCAMTEKDSRRQKQWWSRWKRVAAVRNGRLHVVDADLALRPSPRIAEGLEQVAGAIHPEAFGNPSAVRNSH